MILLDFSATIFAAMYVDLKDGAKPNEDFIRHICLNTIRTYNKQFRHEYGELVLCFDSRSWRELYFPEYKYARKHNKDDDILDWNEIYNIFSNIQKEITENMPYKTVQALGAEGDDIIGVLSNNATEDVLTVSNDKDFVQLLKFTNVKQYRPCVKEMSSVQDPERFLFDMLLTGDKDDGIPNIKCSNDFFVKQIQEKELGNKPTRAPAISQKFKDSLWEIKQQGDDVFEAHLKENGMLDNFIRNRKLIDLCNGYIPKQIQESIKTAFSNAKGNSDMKMIRYFQKHRLQLLCTCLDDFKLGTYKPRLV